jgi:hypothetical protein
MPNEYVLGSESKMFSEIDLLVYAKNNKTIICQLQENVNDLSTVVLMAR